MTDDRLAVLASWRDLIASGAAFDSSVPELARGLLALVGLAEQALEASRSKDAIIASLRARLAEQDKLIERQAQSNGLALEAFRRLGVTTEQVN